jgi:hypothetical protein
MILANGKKAKLLEQERTYLNTLTLKLFINNITPADADVVAAYTQCADGGYAGVTNVGFTAATLNGSNQGQVIAPAITWTFTFSVGGFTVYGYYMTDPADSTLVLAERAPSPFTVTAAGQTYTVTPKKIMTTF